MCWVAGKSGAGGSWSHQRQGAVGRNTLDAARVLVSWVASEVAGSDGGSGSGSNQGEVAVGLDTSDALRILVGWVADPFALSVERAGGDEANSRKKRKCLTHLV